MSNIRLKRTISSALWSAYADALGFPTELATEKAVKQRLGQSRATRTEQWRRQIGGRFGAMVTLPAGAYSDDTQLRLATSRAIRGNGYFDVESFAKIELPVWQAYSLGAGRGSKAAATALCNRSNTWFSNFFNGYTNGGGNGAAMRIQPHVWAAEELGDVNAYLPDVIRNAVCTHGHMRGIAGAVIHAVSLAHAMREARPLSPGQWPELVAYVRAIPNHIAQDSDLSTFWLPTWEQKSGISLKDAIEQVAQEWEITSKNAISALNSGLHSTIREQYEGIVKSENGLNPKERGSGLKCALFANVAAWLCTSSGAQEIINIVANLLESDTDTIATMAGALIGATYPESTFLGPIQDEEYIRAEAGRLYDVSRGAKATSFAYPDILYWQAPRVAVDVLKFDGGQLYFEALGEVTPIGPPHIGLQKNTSWQWLKLETGQTILSKFRTQIAFGEALERLNSSYDVTPSLSESKNVRIKNLDLFGEEDAPIDSKLGSVAVESESDSPTTISSKREDGKLDESMQRKLESNPETVADSFSPPNDNWILHYEPAVPMGMDILTSEAIKNFDPLLIGQHLLYLAERPNGIELSAVYAGIIAKAKIARVNREKQRQVQPNEDINVYEKNSE
ncbi:ADP-ribosylglycohydrolase family protein [Pseudomonas sp. NPDC086112]|uniref:ADP-ribosylglycohydrolase family protein n=1 Tax=Pseudomonas sp. NPDC086112 TaxID=3364430 RepID=UPI003822A240